MKLHRFAPLIVITILTMFVSPSQAQTISVNFAETTGGEPRPNQTLTPDQVAGAAGFEVNNWNNAQLNLTAINNTGSLSNLVDNSGASTTASVFWRANNGWGDGTANTDANNGIPNAMLQRGYLDDTGPGSTALFSVSEIPYVLYDLVVYLSSDGFDQQHGDFTLNGESVGRGGTIVRWSDDPNLVIGRNVLVFQGLTESSLEFIGTRDFGADTAARGSVSGFQIVNIPEPSSAVLGLLLVGGLVIRRRK